MTATLSTLYWLSGRSREALAAAARAADLARVLGDRTLLATAEERRATVLMTMGQHRDEALRVAEEASRVAEEAGALEILHWALADVAELYKDRGELATSQVYWERILEVALRQGDPLLIASTTGDCGEIAYYMGNWSQAHVDCERAVAMMRPLGVPGFTWFALLVLGQLCLAEGDWEGLSRYVEEARAIERAQLGHGPLEQRVAVPAGPWRHEIQRLLAERDLVQGQPAAARSRLVPLLGGPGTDEMDVTILVLLAWAHLELGEIGEAEQVVAEAIARMRADNNRLRLVDALRMQAMIANRRESWSEAEHALEEGLDLVRRMPYPYAEARLLHLYGEMHAQKGESEPACERLEAALAIFRRLGARKDIERVEQALSTLRNAVPRDTSVPSPPTLPRRQGDVVGAPAGRRLSRTGRQAWALEHLRTAGPLSPRAYATALGVSVDTALRDLQELMDRGLVQAAGTTRNRRYVLVGGDIARAIHRTAP